MARVQVSNIRKAYSSLEVIHGIDINIDDGEFVVLVGPSGCGKSTLLRMIAGLEEISGGEIRIGEKLVNNLPPAERDIAMVFQNYALYPHKTVAANMGFSLKMRKMSKEEVTDRITKAADILGLQPYLNRYPRQLSGGQRQRVAMGRAIVRDPHVFLFDEPLSNLDAKLRVQMRVEIRELHQRLNTTTIYVTHDQIEAMTMADKIVVMDSGTVAQIGPPLELYDKPANLFVASFIGSPSMNLIEGVIKAGSKKTQLINPEITFDLPAHKALKDGMKITAGIRPEFIKVGTGKHKAKLTVIEQTGAETHIVMRTKNLDIVSVSHGRQIMKPGQALAFDLPEKHLHLFDTNTGNRL
jgi:multiple sugar transport system ATP-binding protein